MPLHGEDFLEYKCVMGLNKVLVYLITGVVRLVFMMWQNVSSLELLFTSTQDSGRRENTFSCSTASELLRIHTSAKKKKLTLTVYNNVLYIYHLEV